MRQRKNGRFLLASENSIGMSSSSSDAADNEMDTEYDLDTIDFGPDAYGILANMDFGGMNLPEIVEELKDNSDDAGATRTDIFLIPSPDNKTLTQINVLDDGCGMTPKQLFNACRMAAQTNHGPNDIGKFGMGMKNATMAAGRFITIFTKTESHGAIAIVLDTDKMKMDRTFRPTHFTAKAAELAWSLPKDIWRRFSSMPTGTLVNVRNLKETYVRNVAETAKELHRALNLAYINATKNNVSIHSGPLPSKTSLNVNPIDTFYRNRPDALKYCGETSLFIYKNNSDLGIRVIEVLSGRRVLGIDKSTNNIVWGIGSDEPKCYRIWIDRIRTNAGKDKLDYRHDLLDELPEEEHIEVKVRFISLTQQAFKEEGLKGYFSELEQHRRGIYMYRDNRLVAPCLTLGEAMDDKCNRQRMEVIFPPTLDFEMGVRTQKQLTNHLNSSVISDALRVLWHQQNSVCIRAKDMAGVVDDEPDADVVEDKLVSVPVAIRKNIKTGTGTGTGTSAKASDELFTNELVLETPEQTAVINEAASAIIASAVPEIVATTPMFTHRVYGEFAKEMRARLTKANPTWTNHEIVTEIGRLWAIHTQATGHSELVKKIEAAPTAPLIVAPPKPREPTNEELIAKRTDMAVLAKLAETSSVAMAALAAAGSNEKPKEPEPPASMARNYTRYADEIRPWLVKTHPSWPVDKIISELGRLWKIQEEKIKTATSEAGLPPLPKRTPPLADRRATAPPIFNKQVLVRGPKSTDPIVSVNAPTASASVTTRGAREAALRAPQQPVVPPGPLPSRGPTANGSAREIDWARVLGTLPKILPAGADEKKVYNALMSVLSPGSVNGESKK